MQFSYYSPALEVLWKLLKANHINPSRFFSKFDITYSDLKNTEVRTPLKLIPKLWDEAYKQIDSPCFGLDSYKYWHPGYMGALGYAWLSSSTLREGFIRMSRYISILSNSGQIKISETSTEYCLYFEHEQLGINPARSDNALSIILHMCRMNYQEPLNPSQVTFTHSAPPCAGDYFAYFKANVLFNEKFDSISFPISVVDEPLPGANKHLAKLHDQVMNQYLNKLNHDDFAQHVKAFIVKKLPSGIVTGDMAAAEMAMSHRTLQRELSALGTSFKKLLEESRHYLAEKYVNEGTMSMTEITFMLGFSELSSFSRAYKRWTGHSPRV